MKRLGIELIFEGQNPMHVVCVVMHMGDHVVAVGLFGYQLLKAML
jgi:hypothetical protein